MADELGTAVLRLELDTSGLKEALAKAKQQVEQELGGATTAATATTGTTATSRTTPSSSAGVTGPGGGVDERDLVRRFNLGGVVRTLETFSKEISQLESGRTINIGSSWTKALAILQEVDTDLKQVSAGQQLNLNTSWTTALRQLNEVDTDLRSIAGGKRLNLDASWNTALRQLNEIDTDLRSIASGKRLNLRATWNKFFDDAEQVRRDIQTSGEAARKRSRADAQKQQIQQTQQAAARSKEIGSRVSGAIGSGLIGGGFPLLFGQGAGAAAGGAIGGIAGGAIGEQFGFALSVIGTAVGAAFDTALEKGKTLAAGLNDPIGQFDKLREAALFSSKATEKTVDALIAAGRAEEAKIIAENDLNARFGGAENAKEFADATDRLTRTWTEATVVMAGFVAGPLADFIQRLNNEAQIGPENVLAAQNQSQKFVESQFNPFERSLGVNKTVEFNNKQFTGDAASVYQQITEEIIKQKRATDDITKAEAQRRSTAVELEAAAKRNLDINKTNLALITAQAAGNRLEALNLRESLVQKEKTRAINLLPAGDTTVQRETIDLNAQKQLVQINAERLKVQQDIQKAAFTEFQTREQISSGIENTLQLLGTEQGQYRDTLGTIQQISATLDAARRKEAEIGFQIDQARIGGRDEEASRLVDQQRTAALETRKLLTEGAFELQKAGESLKEASITARDNLRNAVLGFTGTRSDKQGLNRFLSPQQQQIRAEQDLKRLLPFFREAQSRFTQLTGVQAPGFRGPTQDVNAAVRDFIATVDREFQAGRDLAKAQPNPEQASRALAVVNAELIKATDALVKKEWLVSVNVVNNANGSSTVDAVNGLTP